MNEIKFTDIYNPLKSYKITKLENGYFVQEFIYGKPWNCGSKCSAEWLMKMFDMPQLDIKNKLILLDAE